MKKTRWRATTTNWRLAANEGTSRVGKDGGRANARPTACPPFKRNWGNDGGHGAKNRAFAHPTVHRARAVLPPLDLGDLVGLGAAGGDDLHRGALLLADQRAGQGRGDRDAALLGVGFGLADDLPYRLLVGVLVDQRHGGAELDGVAGQFRDVDDVGARQLVLELGDAALIVRLLFLGGVIFGVLRQVTVRARIRDMRDDARTVLRLPLLQLGLQRGIAGCGHRNLLGHRFSSFISCRPVATRTKAKAERRHYWRVPDY